MVSEIRQLLEFLIELPHVKAIHQCVVALDSQGNLFPVVLLKKLAENDADIGIGRNGGGLDDLGEGNPGVLETKISWVSSSPG